MDAPPHDLPPLLRCFAPWRWFDTVTPWERWTLISEVALLAALLAGNDLMAALFQLSQLLP